jgi:hypothetical protein
MIPVGLAFITASLPRLSLYSVEEAFVFLLGLVVLHSVTILFLFACLLLWHGVSAAFFWIKLFRAAGVTRYFG